MFAFVLILPGLCGDGPVTPALSCWRSRHRDLKLRGQSCLLLPWLASDDEALPSSCAFTSCDATFLLHVQGKKLRRSKARESWETGVRGLCGRVKRLTPRVQKQLQGAPSTASPCCSSLPRREHHCFPALVPALTHSAHGECVRTA